MSLKSPQSKFTKASVYKEAGEARFAEAECLNENKHPSGAIHLAGYLVECYLKWALCQRSGVQYLQELPDHKLVERLTSGEGHNLEWLCDLTHYRDHFAANDAAKKAFKIAANWSPSLRYVRVCGGKREAVQFLSAIRILLDDIRSWASN